MNEITLHFFLEDNNYCDGCPFLRPDDRSWCGLGFDPDYKYVTYEYKRDKECIKRCRIV